VKRSPTTWVLFSAALAIAPSASAGKFDDWRSSPPAHPEAPGGKKDDDKQKEKDTEKEKETEKAAPPSLAGIGLPLGLGSFGVGLGAPAIGAGAAGAGAVGAGAGALGAGAGKGSVSNAAGGAGAIAGGTSGGGAVVGSPATASLGSLRLGAAGAALHGPHDAVALTPPLAALLENTSSAELASDGDVADTLAAADRMFESDSPSVACGLYERAFAVRRTPANLGKLARCYERVGKISSAWLAFVAAADGATDPKTRSEAEASAARLAKTLPKITLDIVVAKGTKPPEVFYDDRRVDSALWGKPLPVDPGEHVIRVIGMSPWTTRVTIGKTNATSVVHWPDQAPAVGDERVARERPWYVSGRVLLTGSFTLLAGAGTVLGSIWTRSVRSDFNAKNGQPGMTEAELDDLHQRTRTLGIATTALAGVTVIGLGLTALFVSSDTSSDAKPAPAVSLGGWLEAGSAGLVFRTAL